MEWLIFGLVCWVAIRFLAPGRLGCGRWAGHRLSERSAKRRPLPEPPPKMPAESAEERLRRRYVEGALTTEQYERELDALYRAGR